MDEIADQDKSAGFEMFAKRSLKVNTKRAKCSSKDDEDMIREKIEDTGGYELLDEV